MISALDNADEDADDNPENDADICNMSRLYTVKISCKYLLYILLVMIKQVTCYGGM